MRKTLYAGLLAGTAALFGAPVVAQGILDDPTIRQMEDQDIDANQEMLRKLIEAAQRGPIFKISPESVAIDMIAGARGTASIRVTNAGDQVGEISGINVLGSVPGMEMTTSCDEALPRGDFCEITLTYRASREGIVSTSVLGTINERGRPNFEVPVTISIRPVPVVEPEKPAPVPVVIRPDPKPAGPAPRDVAREYFGVIGPIGRSLATPRGFTIISAGRDPGASTEVAGVQYQDIHVETRTMDERYDEAIPYTDASLPVDRDRILTTDRVIKAVLETPVSNVMCNKVV